MSTTRATTAEQNVDGGGAPATAMDKTESTGHDGASTTVRLLAARKKGRARTSFAEMLEALRRRQTHDRAAAMATRKQRRRVVKNSDGEVLIEWLRRKEKPRRSLSHAGAKPRAATVVSGSRRKIIDGELASAVTVHQNYQNYHSI